jgi:hypothetical protein
MKLERYRRLEKRIASADGDSIRERWVYGRRLLCDAEAVTPQGNLQHGIAAKLICQAERLGRKLSEREIRYRMKIARDYPYESQIGTLSADFETWTELRDIAFRQVSHGAEEVPYNPLETDELTRQFDRRGRRMLLNIAHSGGLFETSDYEKLWPEFGRTDSLSEIQAWNEEQDEITRRFLELSEIRKAAFEQLLAAVDDDLTKTFGDALDALDIDENDEDDEA